MFFSMKKATYEVEHTNISAMFSNTRAWELFAGLIGLLLVYSISLAIYRLFFHPLSKYPGPPLAAITNWYTAFYAWRGDMHLQFHSWHRRHGKIVRFGPNSVCIDSHIAISEIYGVRANVRKADGYATLSASHTPNTLTTIDKQAHRFKRRILAQVYSEQGLKEIEEPILENIRDFTKLLGQKNGIELEDGGWGPVHDMADVCDWLTFDVISHLCYGEDFDLLHNDDLRLFPEVVSKITQRSMMCLMQPKLFQYKLDRLLLATSKQKINYFTSYLRQKAAARSAIGNDIKQKDIFYAMMNTKDPKTGQGFSVKELWLESILLLAAGSDTTSTAMSATFFYLLHNPKALARATAEVRSTFTDNEQIIVGPQLNSCKFLQACINESMRLAPSVPGVTPRHVQAGGATIDGEYIPEDTIVGTPIYTIHRNEAYFPNPNEFRAERWIVDPVYEADEDSVRRAQQGFYPFSSGPRSCVGWRLAWAELNIAIARALFLFEMRLAPDAPCCRQTSDGQKCDYQLKSWTTSAVEGPLVQFRRKD